MLRLSSDSAPERERPALLREFFEGLGVRYDTEPLGSSIEIDLTLQGINGLQLLSGRMHGARFRRTRKSADPTDDVCLMLNSRRTHLISQRGREIELGAGEATLLSLTETLDSTLGQPGNLLVLRFPRPQLAPRLPGAPDCFLRRIPRGTQALSLLTDYVEIARDEQRITARELQDLMVTHVYDLVAIALGATRDATEVAQSRGVRAARLHAVKLDIARNLDRPELSVAMLAYRHRCTPRSLQRLFETDGTTLTAYVLAQRLARAHRMLADPRRDGEKISSVAYDCGFGDVSYFNRVFRRYYGTAPSDVRACARQDVADSREPTRQALPPIAQADSNKTACRVPKNRP